MWRFLYSRSGGTWHELRPHPYGTCEIEELVVSGGEAVIDLFSGNDQANARLIDNVVSMCREVTANRSRAGFNIHSLSHDPVPSEIVEDSNNCDQVWIW